MFTNVGDTDCYLNTSSWTKVRTVSPAEAAQYVYERCGNINLGVQGWTVDRMMRELLKGAVHNLWQNKFAVLIKNNGRTMDAIYKQDNTYWFLMKAVPKEQPVENLCFA